MTLLSPLTGQLRKMLPARQNCSHRCYFFYFCKKMQKMKIDFPLPVHCPMTMRKFWRTSLRPFGQNNVGISEELSGEGCTIVCPTEQDAGLANCRYVEHQSDRHGQNAPKGHIARQEMTEIAHIHVDRLQNGIVWLQSDASHHRLHTVFFVVPNFVV